MMSLLGVLLGLLCLIVPCLTETDMYKTHVIISTHHWYLFHCSDLLHVHRYLLFAPLAFFVGVALAFVTPLGGIGMALGIVSLYSSLHHTMETSLIRFGPVVTWYDWGPAFYIGILAAVVTLSSYFLPIGPGYSEMYRPWPRARGNLKERLFVWGRGNKPRARV